MKVKSPSQSAAKWSDRAGTATPDYAAGVQNPKEDWKTATVAAAESYKQGVQKAITDGSFTKGVNRAGSEKQINNSLSKGVARFSAGVAIAQNDYENGVAPFLDVIERTSLPPRKAKGDPSNIQRVAKLAEALHAAKKARR
jgi:hypothetical protein